MTPAGVTRPIFPPANSPNHTLPSLPSAVARGWLFGVGMSNSLMTPADVMRPMRLPRCSENHMWPSDPTVMMRGALPGCGRSNSLSALPSCAMRPMRLPALSVNHSVPSAAIETVVGPLLGLGSGNSVNFPSVVSVVERCACPDAPSSAMPKQISGLRRLGAISRRARICHRRVKVKQQFSCALLDGVALLSTAASISVRGQSTRDRSVRLQADVRLKPDATLLVEAQRALVDKYCVSCHNARLKTGGLVLDKDTIDLARVS